jgi:hypothetical protein
MPTIIEPPAELEPRPGDETITPEQILSLELLKRLRKPPRLEKYPGTFKLRHYQPGEEILHQGQAGWTAFYILTAKDVLGLRTSQLRAAATDADRGRLEKEVRTLTRRREQNLRVRESEAGRARPDTGAAAVPQRYATASGQSPVSGRFSHPVDGTLRPACGPAVVHGWQEAVPPRFAAVAEGLAAILHPD